MVVVRKKPRAAGEREKQQVGQPPCYDHGSGRETYLIERWRSFHTTGVAVKKSKEQTPLIYNQARINAGAPDYSVAGLYPHSPGIELISSYCYRACCSACCKTFDSQLLTGHRKVRHPRSESRSAYVVQLALPCTRFPRSPKRFHVTLTPQMPFKLQLSNFLMHAAA
ncbi:hypothetical protein PTI98_010180 [Pleurotus ostreatus]|nr:hypothetical protein PTI98_010180 [Pleurotus ostreatus]